MLKRCAPINEKFGVQLRFMIQAESFSSTSDVSLNETATPSISSAMLIFCPEVFPAPMFLIFTGITSSLDSSISLRNPITSWSISNIRSGLSSSAVVETLIVLKNKKSVMAKIKIFLILLLISFDLISLPPDIIPPIPKS